MITKKMEAAINEQINAELYSAYLYLSMSAWCEGQNLKGFGNWLRVQYQEETAHALKFFDYVIERGGSVSLKKIDAPVAKWKNIIDVFENVLKHEQHVTALINNLVQISMEEKDFAANNMLQWFVNEQVEEEANATEILEQLKLFEGKGAPLFMLDRELKTRVFVPITNTQA
ncbi:MAG: ferritin [Bacteroidales bacterium]